MKIVILFLSFLYFAWAQPSLNKLYWDSKATDYQPFSPSQYALAVDLFTNLLKDKIDDKDTSSLLQHLELSIHYPKKNILVIIDSKKRGWGFYVIKTDTQVKNLLSIPHRFHDLKTANIGKKLVKKYPYRAIVFNTVHRSILDIAHHRYTLYNAFHLAFSRTFPQETIYQIHGFNNMNRLSDDAKDSDIIISSTSLPTPQTQELVICLNKQSYLTYLYGKDIYELGGTQNAQALLLKEENIHNFIHIEINANTREILDQNRSARKNIQKCLL